VDVAEPTVFLIEVLINGLPVFIDWDRFATKCISLLEIVLAAESI
jgi:hypothetical protein